MAFKKRRKSGNRARRSRGGGRRGKSIVRVGSRGFAAKELLLAAGGVTGGLIGGNLLADLIGSKVTAVGSGWGRVGLKAGIGIAAFLAGRRFVGNGLAFSIGLGPIVAALLDTYGNLMAKRAPAASGVAGLAEYTPSGAMELGIPLAGMNDDNSPAFIAPPQRAWQYAS